MGETRVDLLHLLEDLRDAYPGPLEETILTEIVANALDSGASVIRLLADPVAAALTVADDGSGMQRRALARYHDVAASTKSRGEGIGFAGVGIKLALLLCEEAFTETRRETTHVATRWHLASRHRAPWRWAPPEGLVAERGTAVRLKLRNPLSPLLDPGFLEAALRRHYHPLLDPAFTAVLAAHYPRGVMMVLNGRVVERHGWPAAETAPVAIRLARKRKPSAAGYLLRERTALPEERRGIAISTLGKVIRHGWDWVGVTPATPDRIGGLIEAPGLAGSLTLNKADFIRSGARGAVYLAYRKVIQEAVSRQLAAWGDARDAEDEARRRFARPLERDLERVLGDLADDFPVLATLVERRADGQRRLPMGRAGEPADARALVAASFLGASEAAAAEAREPPPAAEAPAEAREPATVAERPSLPGAAADRRPARLGLMLQREARPDDPELGRLGGLSFALWNRDVRQFLLNSALFCPHEFHARAAAPISPSLNTGRSPAG